MTPEQFISTSDYATLKNDDEGTITLVIPGSQSIPAADVITFSAEEDIGSPGAIMQCTIEHSWRPGRKYVTQLLQYIGEGEVGGNPAIYNANIAVYRSSPSAITVIAYLLNNNPDILITEPNTYTVTVDIATFLPPFE